eukprot:5659994-Amphidinium_carterae.1
MGNIFKKLGKAVRNRLCGDFVGPSDPPPTKDSKSNQGYSCKSPDKSTDESHVAKFLPCHRCTSY